MMKVSILVPAHNEEQNILDMLVSLERQSYAKNIDEILIADNASTDQTFELISEFSKGSALNIGSWRRVDSAGQRFSYCRDSIHETRPNGEWHDLGW